MRMPPNIDPLIYDPDVLAEHRLVRYTLRQLGERDRHFEVLNEQAKLGEPGRLTLDALNEVLPLPIRLFRGRFSAVTATASADGTVNVGGGRTMPGQVAHLVTDMATSAIGREYRGLQRGYRRDGESRPIGMVFSFNRIRGGLILHDGAFNTEKQTIIRAAGITVRLERYEGVLRAIAAGDTGIVPNAAAASAAQSQSAAIAAAIHKRFGHGTAARLALFIAVHQVDHPTPEQQQRIQRINGQTWLVMTGPQLAQAVDAKARSVQAAIAMLKNQGVLHVRRGGFPGDGCRNGYWLDVDAILADDTFQIQEPKQ